MKKKLDFDPSKNISTPGKVRRRGEPRRETERETRNSGSMRTRATLCRRVARVFSLRVVVSRIKGRTSNVAETNRSFVLGPSRDLSFLRGIVARIVSRGRSRSRRESFERALNEIVPFPAYFRRRYEKGGTRARIPRSPSWTRWRAEGSYKF